MTLIIYRQKGRLHSTSRAHWIGWGLSSMSIRWNPICDQSPGSATMNWKSYRLLNGSLSMFLRNMASIGSILPTEENTPADRLIDKCTGASFSQWFDLMHTCLGSTCAHSLTPTTFPSRFIFFRSNLKLVEPACSSCLAASSAKWSLVCWYRGIMFWLPMILWYAETSCSFTLGKAAVRNAAGILGTDWN